MAFGDFSDFSTNAIPKPILAGCQWFCIWHRLIYVRHGRRIWRSMNCVTELGKLHSYATEAHCTTGNTILGNLGI
jgi:hypothetical protein